MTVTVNAAILTATFVQAASPGPISVPGLKVGDVMIAISAADTSGSFGNGSLIGTAFYEAVVSVDDEIQQNVSTTTPGATLVATFFRP